MLPASDDSTRLALQIDPKAWIESTKCTKTPKHASIKENKECIEKQL